MPSIHIPEDVFAAYVDAEGGYQAAKDRLQAVARGDADAPEVNV